MNKLQFMFDEISYMPIKMGDEVLTNEGIIKATTLVSEINRFGYTLSAEDIIKLAKSSEAMQTFFADFKKNIRVVLAKPMYPDFPNQVLSMSAAEYRFHQSLHYLSTYGLEMISGEEVLKGWMPDVKETKKTKVDKQLLSCKLLRLVDKSMVDDTLFSVLCSRRERLTETEKEVIREVLPCVSAETLNRTNIKFKENLMVIAEIFFDGDKKQFVDTMAVLCKHTGDVFKCADYILTSRHYHLKTAEKKALVKLIESYPIADFKANCYLSNKKGDRVKTLMEFLSYNTYSKSAEHMEVVRMLRNGELSSWESMIKRNMDSEDVLRMIAKRPGMMFRWMKWLLSEGFTADQIVEAMNASKLSTQTICNAYAVFGSKEYAEKIARWNANLSEEEE